MAERYVSDPLELPPGDPEEITRADLVFYDLDHSAASFTGRIFLNNLGADASTPTDDVSYAASFVIFGHGGCFGDVGHCDPAKRDDPFDLRPPHQLTPATRTVIVTDAVKRLIGEEGTQSVVVTVVAVVPGARSNDVLQFSRVRLLTYE